MMLFIPSYLVKSRCCRGPTRQVGRRSVPLDLLMGDPAYDFFLADPPLVSIGD
jgi:hypothetical protein